MARTGAAVAILSSLMGYAAALPTPVAEVTWDMVHVSDDITLDVAFAGRGDTTMVLLHGYPETAWVWRGMIDPLLQDPSLRLVMPNQRGYNMSSKPKGIGNYNISHLVADAVGLIGSVSKGKKVHLVGHDWGGMMVAWCVAGYHPELVETLSIINAPHPSVFDDLIRHSEAEQKASSYQFFFDNPMSDLVDPSLGFKGEAWYDEDADTQSALEAAFKVRGSRPAALNWYRANIFAGKQFVTKFTEDMETGLDPDMPVSVPTLVIWATGDPYFATEECLAGLPKFVDDLTIIRDGYEDLGHWVAQRVPKQVSADILQYIANRSAPLLVQV